MFKNVLLILIALTAAGCISATATLLDPDQERFDPVPLEEVEVYLSAADVPGEFIKIAIIRSEGKEGVTTEEKMLEKMKEKAGELGANGIILHGVVIGYTKATAIRVKMEVK